MTQAKYETLARWRNGWHLIQLSDGRQYLRRAFRGQHPVNAVKDGLLWFITDPNNNNERVRPEILR